MADFIDGPLWFFAVTIFILGVLWNLVAVCLGKRRVDYSVPRDSAASHAIKTVFTRFIPNRHMVPRVRLQIVAGYMFHLGLFVLLFFAAPHVRFIEENITGFGWTPVPHWAFIVASQFAFFGLILLWLRRITNLVSRLISRIDDHVAAVLTFVVMLTGCLALLESFEALRLLHRFFVELLLIYFPFSCLMHTFTFLPSRLFTGAWFGRRGIDS